MKNRKVENYTWYSGYLVWTWVREMLSKEKLLADPHSASGSRESPPGVCSEMMSAPPDQTPPSTSNGPTLPSTAPL